MPERHLGPDAPNELEELTPDIVRIPLPLPLTDLQVVNAYVIRGYDGVTLVDPGWADERNETALLAALDGLGYQPGDVRRILVTHAHWDHYSRAADWQRRYGTTVYLGHILPRITPSIALERVPETLPLKSYLESLQLFVRRRLRHDCALDALGLFHGIAAIIEVAVHLELLEYRGQLTVDTTDVMHQYVAA